MISFAFPVNSITVEGAVQTGFVLLGRMTLQYIFFISVGYLVIYMLFIESVLLGRAKKG
jgi:hypothetical protein